MGGVLKGVVGFRAEGGGVVCDPSRGSCLKDFEKAFFGSLVFLTLAAVSDTVSAVSEALLRKPSLLPALRRVLCFARFALLACLPACLLPCLLACLPGGLLACLLVCVRARLLARWLALRKHLALLLFYVEEGGDGVAYSSALLRCVSVHASAVVGFVLCTFFFRCLTPYTPPRFCNAETV